MRTRRKPNFKGFLDIGDENLLKLRKKGPKPHHLRYYKKALGKSIRGFKL